MSNSELFLTGENKEDTQSKLLNTPTLDLLDDSHIASSAQEQPDYQRSHEEEEEAAIEENIEKKEQKNKESNILDHPSPNSHQKQQLLHEGELEAADDADNDDESGFKTPTSLEHRIMVKECPGAPRRPAPRILSMKRKASSSSSPPPNVNARRSPQLDLSREVESFLPKLVRADFYNKKTKKARIEP